LPVPSPAENAKADRAGTDQQAAEARPVRKERQRKKRGIA
jgi:hypothetical protein